ncbi:hypothetical protein [Candidatus Sororendozoicomonas aggregata]|uniref:hypothetical protein n=1 Tax=Candidatus Sororendozoicomonas aggregata TaxID=3073239 RepID=UPI002ED32481
MKDTIHLLLAAMAISTSASAATISFTQTPPPPKITTPVKVMAPGIKGLEKFVKAQGKFTIENEEYLKRPVGTEIVVTNMKGKTQQIEVGTIHWAPETSPGGSAAEPYLYTFILSAGGYTKQAKPKQDYCLTVSVDGHLIGTNATSHKAFWSPTVLKNVPFTKDSNIDVNISYPVRQPS